MNCIHSVARLAALALMTASLCAAAERPRMYFADTVSGRPFSKDPAVVKFQGRYLLYYSLPDYPNKASTGWSIGIAASANLVEWKKIGELKNSGEAERNGFCSPGAIVLGDRIHLFYQTYGNARHDAICHAWSKDGIAFTRDPTNPVFRPTGSWNCGRAIDADVIAHQGRLLLYWATRDPAFKIQMQGVAARRWPATLPGTNGRNSIPKARFSSPNCHGRALALRPQPWPGTVTGSTCFTGATTTTRRSRSAWPSAATAFTSLACPTSPFLPNGPPGTWNSSESGHPFFFHDDDGNDYLFFQGNNHRGRTWYLSMMPIEWKDDKPVLVTVMGE